MDEYLTPAPTVIGTDDCTDGSEWKLIDNEEDVPPLTTTPRFSSRLATANDCFVIRASSMCAWERFLDNDCSTFLSYNARYWSSEFLGMAEVQMAISPYVIFNTSLSTRDWCLGVNFLPHHLHNQDTFSFWLLAPSSIKGQWKMLVKESNSAPSPRPLSTNKSTKMESVVSAETVISCDCDGVVASGPTGGRWWALILEWIDMDELAQW